MINVIIIIDEISLYKSKNIRGKNSFEKNQASIAKYHNNEAALYCYSDLYCISNMLMLAKIFFYILLYNIAFNYQFLFFM